MIRVLVVDDHAMFAESLVRLLSEDPEITVIGVESTGLDGVARAHSDRPDIVLMDFSLPDTDGATATKLLKTSDPEIKVITLTGTDHPGSYYAALEAGSSAWVRKTGAFSELRAAVHQVYEGGSVSNDELADLPTADQLAVHYQPVVNLASEAIVGFEALVRWQHPERGLILPGAFLPRAERTGFINELGRQVGVRACTQLATWKRQTANADHLWMAVNLSASGIRREAVIGDVASVIELTGIRPCDLVLEVTESVFIEDAALALRRLKQLKALGVRLSLDDFGTGYSSLSYLQKYPFDHVKLDISFTSQLPGSARAMSLVEAIHHMALALGMQGIAEGIERADQARALIDAGWELGQGFLYSRPVDSAVATRLISPSGAPTPTSRRLVAPPDPTPVPG